MLYEVITRFGVILCVGSCYLLFDFCCLCFRCIRSKPQRNGNTRLNTCKTVARTEGLGYAVYLLYALYGLAKVANAKIA